MTIAKTGSETSDAGNGATVAFAFPFRFFADTDLQVFIVVDSTGLATLQTLTTDYTIVNTGTETGGTVTMVAAPASGETLLIQRVIPETQSTDYQANDAFPAETHETALDRLTLITQQGTRSGGQHLKFPTGDIADPTLEASGSRASKLQGYDSSGALLTYSITPVSTAGEVVIYSDVAALLASAEASRGVGALWQAGGFDYHEVASGEHITLSGSGVKLQVAKPIAFVTPAMLGLPVYDSTDSDGVKDAAALANSALLTPFIRWAFDNKIDFDWDQMYLVNPDLIDWDLTSGNWTFWEWEMRGQGGMMVRAGASFDQVIKIDATNASGAHNLSKPSFKDFRVRQETRRDQAGNGVEIISCSNIEMHNLVIDGFDGHGLVTRGLWDSQITFNSVQHCGNEAGALASIAHLEYDDGSNVQNTNSLYIEKNHVEHSWWHNIEIGGATAGGGATHINMIANKTHFRNSITGAANVFIHGQDTDVVCMTAEQNVPGQDFGLLIDDGASNVTTLGCEFGSGPQPVMVTSSAGPGHKFIGPFFKGKTGTNFIRNDSSHPVQITAPKLPVGSAVTDLINGVATGTAQGDLNGLRSLISDIGAPDRQFDTRTAAANQSLTLRRVANASDATIMEFVHQYGTANVNDAILMLKAMQGGTLTNLLELNAETGFAHFAATVLRLGAGSANPVRIVTGMGSPEGAVSAPIGSTFHRADGGAGTSFYVKEAGASGNTGWAAK